MNHDDIKKRLDELWNDIGNQNPSDIGSVRIFQDEGLWLVATLREALKELEQIRKGADQFEDALNELSGINSLDEESES